MDEFIIEYDTDIDDLAKLVNEKLKHDYFLKGDMFKFGGFLCQAMIHGPTEQARQYKLFGIDNSENTGYLDEEEMSQNS